MPYGSVGFALNCGVEKAGVPEWCLESFPFRKPAHASKVCTAKVLKRHVNSDVGRGGKKPVVGSWGTAGGMRHSALQTTPLDSLDHALPWFSPSTGNITLLSTKKPS